MYSMFEMANLDPFGLDLAITENKFEIAVETALNQYEIDSHFSMLVEAEGDKNGKGLIGLLKSFGAAIKAFWNNLVESFQKAFSKEPPPDKECKLKDPNKMKNAVMNANTSALELIQGVAKGTKDDEDVKSWKDSISKTFSNIAHVVVPAASLIGIFGVKEKFVDPIDREVDDIIKNIANEQFTDAYKTLARTEGQENYNTIKQQKIKEIMAYVQKTNKKFADFLKDARAQMYLGEQLDRYADAMKNPNTAKDIIKDEKEKRRLMNHEANQLRKTAKYQKGIEPKIQRSKDKLNDAKADLDSVKSKFYHDHESSTIKKDTMKNRVKDKIDDALFKSNDQNNEKEDLQERLKKLNMRLHDSDGIDTGSIESKGYKPQRIKAMGNIRPEKPVEEPKKKSSMADKAKGNI